jgi:hypothetical protein
MPDKIVRTESTREIKSSQQLKGHVSQWPELFIAVSYFLTFVLVLVPYYNWLYRVMINSLHLVLLWGSLATFALILTPIYVRRVRFKRFLLVIILGLLVFFTGGQVHKWRYCLTDLYIKSSHCETNALGEDGLILGGISEVKIDGMGRTGAFENHSHCLFVYCREEFYYCDDPEVVIGQ